MTVEPDSSLGRCLLQGPRGKAEIEVRETKVQNTTNDLCHALALLCITALCLPLSCACLGH